MKDKLNNIKCKLFGKEKTEEEQNLINDNIIEMIAPAGGVDFTHEKYITTGAGYEACLFVYKYPKNVGQHWLSSLTNIDDTITCIDITSMDRYQIMQNLKKSLEEQRGRYNTAKSDAEAIDAQQQYQEVEEMYKEVASFGKIMKGILVRIYIPKHTMYECEVKLKEVLKDLEGNGYRAAVCLNETKQDYRNILLSYNQQQKTIFQRNSQPILASTIAAGNPFHYSSLSDPLGTYLGQTITGGAVLFDLFHNDSQRMSYDFVCIGKKGVGKSTTLKKLMEDRAIRGDLVRVFDVDGGFTTITERLGGKVIKFDGSGDSTINLLQILPNDDSQETAFHNHMSKVAIIYDYLLKDRTANENEVNTLKQLLKLLYVQFQICDKDGKLIKDIKTMAPTDFPILQDLWELTTYIINHLNTKKSSIFETANIRDTQKDVLIGIESKLMDLCTMYGSMFNGYTTIENFYNEPIVCFNLETLTKAERYIFNGQFYNILSMCWDNCLETGTRMKDLVHDEIITEKDVTNCLILIDEAHMTINSSNPAGVAGVVQMVREARKYFTSIGLASQSVRDFVPDVDSIAMTSNGNQSPTELMKTLFEMTTYKFIMQQDSNAIPKLREVFQNTFSESEIETIPVLEKGDCILSIAGCQNLQFNVWLSPEEEYYFDGGK